MSPLALLAAAGLAAAPLESFERCLLVKDLDGGAAPRREGTLCAERLPACSTFKIPLALMAFDAGVLKDEGSRLAWDGARHPLEAWNKDQSAASWMRESVVWFSQRLTPMLGAERIARYLEGFGYGSRDMSGGLTTAWLTTAGGTATLTISPDEQLAFWTRLWRRKLPVSARARALVERITYLEATPGGLRLHGKSGSGILPDGRRVGWFVARLTGTGRERVAVLAIRDKAPAGGDAPVAGREARALMAEILAADGWW